MDLGLDIIKSSLMSKNTKLSRLTNLIKARYYAKQLNYPIYNLFYSRSFYIICNDSNKKFSSFYSTIILYLYNIIYYSLYYITNW